MGLKGGGAFYGILLGANAELCALDDGLEYPLKEMEVGFWRHMEGFCVAGSRTWFRYLDLEAYSRGLVSNRHLQYLHDLRLVCERDRIHGATWIV